MKIPTIIVVTYNRPESLKRLLSSIYYADYSAYKNISLVISIDGQGHEDILNIAEQFDWLHGKKYIIVHEENLGLRQHILTCGDMSEKFENIIILEDDMFVGKFFYDFSVKSLNFYKNEKKITGISLYAYKQNEYAGKPFIPMQDEHDVFFMQIPSSWGQIWTKDQWDKFKNFYLNNPEITEQDKLPDVVKKWPESSWKKYFYKYMVDFDLYFVYPYISYATNYADIGVHYPSATTVLQVPLMSIFKETFLFPEFEKSNIIYDAYFEIHNSFFWEIGIKENIDFCVDFYGLKQIDLFQNEYWLSIKNCSHPDEQFGLIMLPIENNIIYYVRGSEISFSNKSFYEEFISLDIEKQITKIYHELIYDKGFKDGYISGKAFIKSTRFYKLGYFLLKPLKKIINRINK